MDRVKEHCTELHTKILGWDATASSSGFVDTKNGCVATFPRELKLAAAKSEKTEKQ